MKRYETYCSPGNSWAACFAQRYNCSPEQIEEVLRDCIGSDYERASSFYNEMKRRGYVLADYCEDCGDDD